MKYILSSQLDGGARAYGIRRYSFEGTASNRPRAWDAWNLANQIMPNLAANIGRQMMYEWVYGALVARNGVGVEIGVDFGDGLVCALELAGPTTMIGVDPYLSQGFDPWFSQGQGDMDARYELVRRRFAINGKVQLIRATSDKFFAAAVDEELKVDWVHVDGDHREESAYRDIVNSYRIVKVGGYIIVDDVHNEMWKKDLVAAVDRARAELAVEVVHDESDPVVFRVK